MLTCPDAPKTLRFPLEVDERNRHLNSPHALPLTRFVKELRRTQGAAYSVPFFDPCDGCADARVLFLGEAPGPKAVKSGFISRNNPDETAKNSFELHRDAGLARLDVALWNIVPWYVGAKGKIRPVSESDLREARVWLTQLLGLLPKIRGVVLVGDKAQRGFGRGILQPNLQVFESPHPSPSNLNTRPESRDRILESWSSVATWLRGIGPG
jgi:uracil-DNA glycosylase